MIWWTQEKVRLAAEIKALEALAQSEDWLSLDAWSQHDLSLAAELTITAHGVPYPVWLVYPDYFPDVPAWVAPRDTSARWSDHQFGRGGALCLELRPDNWTPDATGADVVRSAYGLLDQENPLGQGDKGAVVSAHEVTPVQRFDWDAKFSILLENETLDRLTAGSASGLQAVRWYGPGVIPMFLSDTQGRAEGTTAPLTDQPFLMWDIPVLRSAAPPPSDLLIARATLAEAAGLEGEDAATFAAADKVLVIFQAGAELVPYLVLDAEQAVRRKWFPYVAQKGVRNGATAGRATAKVAVIGAGSVGSKIAETLVRSGVRDLLLVDGDVLLPPNLERNALDWSSVGARKVDGLRARLLAIAPDAKVRAVAETLSWQRSPRTHAAQIESITRCEIVIDATGDPGSSLLLGSLAARAGKPFLSVEVFEGGIGVLVATCLPTRDPPFAQARANFEAWCEIQGHRFPRPPAGRYGGFDEDGAPVVADDAAVTVAAGHAGRAILDVLDGVPAPQDRAWQLIGLRDAWIFGKLGLMIGLSVGDPVVPIEAEADPETDRFILARIGELLGAIAAAR
jgi:hypothetical protein